MERTINVVVYKPSAVQSPRQLTGYKGSVALTSTVLGEDQVSIQIAIRPLST